MKIAIITNHSYMLYQFRRELVGQLLQDHEVVLMMPFVGHEQDFAQMGCHCMETDLERRGTNPFRDFKLVKTYYQMLRKEKPDLVITYSIKPNIYAGTLCGLLKIPYYANVQGLGTAFQKKSLAWLATGMYRVGLRRVKKVFFENQGNANEFVNRGIVKAEKIRVLHGAGVNLDHYEAKPYPEDEEQIHFLYLGRIMKEKGMDELLEAMRMLYDQYGQRAVLDMVGFFEDEYKEQVEELQAKKIVNFHGFQSETRPYYEMAHCVVLPSYHEGMSNVLLEAAACARPLITSDIYGCKEAVEEGVTGFLCQAHSAADLYAQMNRFMQLTAAERRQMGLNGRQKMEREFDKKLVVKETVTALEALEADGERYLNI